MEFKKIQFLIQSIAKAKLLVVEKLLGKYSSCVSILSRDIFDKTGDSSSFSHIQGMSIENFDQNIMAFKKIQFLIQLTVCVDLGILYLTIGKSWNSLLRRLDYKIVGLFLSFIFLRNWRNCNRNAGYLNQ